MFIEKIETPTEAVVIGREIVPTDYETDGDESEDKQRREAREKKSFSPLAEQIREDVESDLSELSENEDDDERGLFYPFSSGVLPGMRKDKQPSKVVLGEGDALYKLTVVNIGRSAFHRRRKRGPCGRGREATGG